MIRTKILGPERFSQTRPLHLFEKNSDFGHFSIGPGDIKEMIVEEALIPPKQLWIRAKIHIDPCPDIPVSGKDSGFVWKGKGRCAAIKLEGVQILYAQKGEEDTHWRLSCDQEIYVYQFAVAPTIHQTNNEMHLWPCGGSVNNILDAEQLFTQIGNNEEEMFPNTYSSWKKYLAMSSNTVFESPSFNHTTFLNELKTGKFLVHIEQKDQRFCFASCRIEPSEHHDFIDILCERMPS